MVQALEDIVSQDLPAAFQLLKEMNENVTQVTQLVDSMLAKVKRGEVSTDKGLSFLEVKYHMLLSYLINLTYVVLRKCSGNKIEGDPSIDRLVEIRTVLEKMRPIEHKLKYQIDKMVKSAVTGSSNASDPGQFRANPVNMMSKLGDSGSDSEEEDKTSGHQEKKTSGLYVPPKLAAVHYDGDESRTDRQTRILDRAKKRALSSSVMQELREEYLDTPVEVTDHSATKAVLTRHRQNKEEYEEEYFTRLPQTKQDKLRSRQMTTIGSVGDELTRFGDYSALSGGPGGSGGSGKRKATKGKGKSKKSSKKRKFH